jgi:hypothetical protein
MAYRSAKIWTGSVWENLAVAVPNVHRWLINDVTNVSYTLQLSDAGKVVRLTNSSAMTLTVPADSSVNFEVGQEIIITQFGSGEVTVSEGVDVTVNSLGGNLGLLGQYAVARLIKVASDEWLLSGDLTA